MSARTKLSSRATVVAPHVMQKFPARLPQFDQQFSLPGWAELLAAVPINYGRNTEIFGDREPVQYLYKVVEGAVRTCKILSDGRRHIAGFYLSGDFFGLEMGHEHTLSSEAITQSRVLIIKRDVLAVLAKHDPEIARQLLKLTGDELNRVQAHVTLLIQSASERVAGFLLEMASRTRTTELELPMSRQDIGDYLGLTIETVSRVLGDFEAVAAIKRPTSHRVVLRDHAALFALTAR
jgi:CRP/FNR family transcriptional regulator, nitrogen fixation regulation protein